MSQGFKTVRQKIEVEGKRNKRVPGFVVDMSGHNVLQPNPMTDDEFKGFLASQGQKRTKFDSVVEKAIKWIAVESKYMSDVKKDLEALQPGLNELNKAPSRGGWLSFFSGSNSTKLVRKALKDFRMVGRCERREARLDKEIVDILEELKGQVSATASLHELEALKVKIETEARSILKETSFYEGGIKTKLENIQRLVAQHIPEDDELRCALDELFKDINRVLDWMNGLTINLRQARSASERYFAAIYPKVYLGGNEPNTNKN